MPCLPTDSVTPYHVSIVDFLSLPQAAIRRAHASSVCND